MDNAISLKALILCGGKSSRLGFPKWKLLKENQNILDWWYRHASKFCIEVWISGKSEQQISMPHLPIILDQDGDKGPMEGVYRAFQYDSGSYWMIIACDLFFVQDQDISRLIYEMDTNFEAIAYYDSEIQSPFPLFSILSPALNNIITESYLRGNKSLRDVLQKAKCKTIIPGTTKILNSINTLTDFENWKISTGQNECL